MENLLTGLPPADRFMLQGELLYLLGRDRLYSTYSVADFDKRIMAAVAKNQFRLYRRDSGPVALMTWAFLSDDLDTRMQEEVFDLDPDDWDSGPHLWYMDFVAPFGHGKMVINDMGQNIFPDRLGKAQRAKRNRAGEFVLQYFYGNVIRRYPTDTVTKKSLGH